MIRSLDEGVATRAPGAIRRPVTVPFGEPEGVARLVSFVGSAEARHVNGAAWVVDGGSIAA
jgi:NAD(P)-dependent dehydrogenase (short-subunit alcohol dehydrogenase family)